MTQNHLYRNRSDTHGVAHDTPASAVPHPFRLSYEFLESWNEQPLIERLGIIMHHMPDPLEWLKADRICVLASFRHTPPESWGEICECYRRIHGNLRILESAVDQWLQAQQRARDDGDPDAFADAVVSFEELMTLTIPPRDAYMPWLSERSLVMMYGPRGVGKTMALLSLALSLASGRPFLRWQVMKQVGVLYVDGEMPLDDLRSRAITLTRGDIPPQIAFLPSELVYARSGQSLTLATTERRYAVESIVAQRPDIRVLVLDNVSCLFPGISEDKKQDWEPINAWLIGLRHRGVTVILGHHAGKSGQQRGTSAREDALDTVIALTLPPDHRAEEGCHFYWHFEKSRGVNGETVTGLDVRLEKTPEGVAFTYATLEVSRTEQVKTMLIDGIPAKAIAEELTVHLSYVYRLKKHLGL